MECKSSANPPRLLGRTEESGPGKSYLMVLAVVSARKKVMAPACEAHGGACRVPLPHRGLTEFAHRKALARHEASA